MNPYLIIGLIGAYLVSFVAGGAIGWHEKSVRVPALLEAQQTTDKEQCAKAQKITKDANDALTKSRNTIAANLSTYKLQHPSTCVSVAPSTSVPASGGQYAGANGKGLSSDWLREYASIAETYRSQFTVCTQFLDQERSLQQ